MKISIITVVRNNVATINDAIESVLSQTYKNIEYIIVDGASTDGTVEVVQGYTNKIDKFISEKDQGLYDAMNKGIGLATGDVIGILNSDDVYFDKNVLENIVNTFRDKQLDSVFGDLYYVNKDDLNKIVRYWKSSDFELGSFAKGWHPPHPAFFVKKDIYEKYGMFDLQLKVSADFDLMLRFLEKYQISSMYLPKILVKMRIGGESNSSLKNIITSNQSILKSFKKNGIRVNRLMYLFYRLVPKIIQIIKRGR
jgi:glycosyltransferase